MKRFYLILYVLMTAACATHHQARTRIINQSDLIVNGKLYTSAFQQQAAEYQALCLQAYNIARLRLDESLQQQSTKPRAVVSDIDETILDNSPYAVKRALEGKSYDQASWSEWTARGTGDTLAGSLSFFKYAASKNVEVFYITNRLEDERSGTIRNLQRYGFPFADNAHVLLKENTSSKEIRRQKVAASHEIVLLLGDNLADFSQLFDKKSTMERSNSVLQSTSQFGKKFIVFPNCNYGDWEGAIYNYQYGLTPLQKDSAIKANLKAY